jgi:uncharacterized membrane protein YfcA
VDAADLTLLLTAATAAGWVDAVVGGGGLLMLPAMLIGAPQIPIATVLGTNKLTAIAGTTSAAITYARRTPIDWKVAGPAGAGAIVFAGLGASAASSITTAVFRPAILAALLAVAAFVTFRPAMGTLAQPHKRTPTRTTAAIGIAGTAIAFYDGLIGPGTGTFLVLTMTATIGADYLAGSAIAKVVNAGTNLGALAVFAYHGHVWWKLGAALAVANIVGAQLGARLALRKGAAFVRAVLLTVVCGLVAKLSFDILAG